MTHPVGTGREPVKGTGMSHDGNCATYCVFRMFNCMVHVMKGTRMSDMMKCVTDRISHMLQMQWIMTRAEVNASSSS
eukprot:CAMPEP_0182436104 /NCGR_PEP_ID=MMETSP1167-20130531/79551_1 /TAXON_ID=2988 /ORGANISM="Mallomonas Sp, Strain CCMP3275" /LENGTH=76 /DNA_ID=CAMNT_0024627881 /DNA_START=76 /DNA_END=306 /DNA_ORIENTATION=-